MEEDQRLCLQQRNLHWVAQGESLIFLSVIQNSICILFESGVLLNSPSLIEKEVLKDGGVKNTWTPAPPVWGNFTGERHLLCCNSCPPELIFQVVDCYSFYSWGLGFALEELIWSYTWEDRYICLYFYLSWTQTWRSASNVASLRQIHLGWGHVTS